MVRREEGEGLFEWRIELVKRWRRKRRMEEAW